MLKQRALRYDPDNNRLSISIVCHSPGTCAQLAPELLATPRAPFAVDNCPPIGMFIFEFKVKLIKENVLIFYAIDFITSLALNISCYNLKL